MVEASTCIAAQMMSSNNKMANDVGNDLMLAPDGPDGWADVPPHLVDDWGMPGCR
jgi:hypothetical protein